MPNPITHILLTPLQAEEKALIVKQIKMNSHGPWVNSKITSLPKLKGTTPESKKKD
jgi:hypothetical protein